MRRRCFYTLPHTRRHPPQLLLRNPNIMNRSAPIVVVGAGTFGLSSAWHLVRGGYKNVTVLDRHPPPSVASAGYDLNKIFRTEYAEDVYTRLAEEARDVWLSEPVLKGCYHENGCAFLSLLPSLSLLTQLFSLQMSSRFADVAHRGSLHSPFSRRFRTD